MTKVSPSQGARFWYVGEDVAHLEGWWTVTSIWYDSPGGPVFNLTNDDGRWLRHQPAWVFESGPDRQFVSEADRKAELATACAVREREAAAKPVPHDPPPPLPYFDPLAAEALRWIRRKLPGVVPRFGLALAVALALFPPWHVTFRYEGSDCGYSFIGSPPAGCAIDLWRLIVEWLAVAGGTLLCLPWRR